MPEPLTIISLGVAVAAIGGLLLLRSSYKERTPNFLIKVDPKAPPASLPANVFDAIDFVEKNKAEVIEWDSTHCPYCGTKQTTRVFKRKFKYKGRAWNELDTNHGKTHIEDGTQTFPEDFIEMVMEEFEDYKIKVEQTALA